MKMADYITKFEAYLLTERRVSDNTFSAYKRDIAQFIQFLAKENIDLTKVTVQDLKNFLHYLHNYGIGARSIARKISSLKTLFAYLADRYDFYDCAQELHIPKVEKKLPHYLSEEEIEQLFEVAQQDRTPIGSRNTMMLYLLYVTGIRVSELTTLRTSDIQYIERYLSVHGKGGKQRLIPLPEPIIGMLTDYINGPLRTFIQKKSNSLSVDYLFPICYGGKIKPISRQSFWMILKSIWKKAGIKRAISPHKVRHSFATHMLKKGANLRALQMLLGHENLSTVQIYTHVETSYLRTVYDKKHPRS